METFKWLFGLIVFLAIIAFAIFLIWAAPEGIHSDYDTQITVDKAEKIQQAVSNAVNDVTSRGFIVIDLDVDRFPVTGNYGITVRGITQANLLKKD